MSTSPFSVSRFRKVFIFSWLFIIANHILLLKWFGLSWKISVIDSLVNNFQLLLACLLVINLLRFYLPQRERYINLFVWNIILTGVVILITRWALHSFFKQNDEYLVFLDRSLIIRSSLDFLLLGCVTLISVVWYNLREQKEQDARKQDSEKLAKDAELFKLRQQLQPHFLFNSLNSINALIGTRPDEARKMIQQLSDFLRGTIKKEDHQIVTLREELQYLQLYLDIEKVRFENRLSTNIEIDEKAFQMKLPALLLQPVAENAIKFGLYDTTGDILIRIKAIADATQLVIEVQNPFDPETSSSSQGTGFGLKSVQRRLYLLFGRNDLLHTQVKENIFTTTMKIPQVSDVSQNV